MWTKNGKQMHFCTKAKRSEASVYRYPERNMFTYHLTSGVGVAWGTLPTSVLITPLPPQLRPPSLLFHPSPVLPHPPNNAQNLALLQHHSVLRLLDDLREQAFVFFLCHWCRRIRLAGGKMFGQLFVDDEIVLGPRLLLMARALVEIRG